MTQGDASDRLALAAESHPLPPVKMHRGVFSLAENVEQYRHDDDHGLRDSLKGSLVHITSMSATILRRSYPQLLFLRSTQVG